MFSRPKASLIRAMRISRELCERKIDCYDYLEMEPIGEKGIPSPEEIYGRNGRKGKREAFGPSKKRNELMKRIESSHILYKEGEEEMSPVMLNVDLRPQSAPSGGKVWRKKRRKFAYSLETGRRVGMEEEREERRLRELKHNQMFTFSTLKSVNVVRGGRKGEKKRKDDEEEEEKRYSKPWRRNMKRSKKKKKKNREVGLEKCDKEEEKIVEELVEEVKEVIVEYEEELRQDGDTLIEEHEEELNEEELRKDGDTLIEEQKEELKEMGEKEEDGLSNVMLNLLMDDDFDFGGSSSSDKSEEEEGYSEEEFDQEEEEDG